MKKNNLINNSMIKNITIVKNILNIFCYNFII